MPRPIAYKTGTIQPPNTAKQSNILVGVGPSNWGAGAANATFYNGLDSSFQYVIIKNSAIPAMWGTGDFTTGSLLTTINGLPDRVGQTRFTNANTAISWSLASGEYSILKSEQPYGEPITNGLVISVNGPSTGKNLFNAATWPNFTGWGYYGNFYSYDITNDPPYPGSTTKTAIRLGGIYCSSGQAMEAGKTYTFSFWMKKIFWPSDGVISWNNQFGSGETNTWQGGIGPTPGNGWIKYTQTFTCNATRYSFFFYCYSPTDPTFRDTTGGVICAEFQLEEGSVATSYAIPSVDNSISMKPINEGLLNTSSLSLVNSAYFNTSQSGVFNFDGIDDYAVLTDASLTNYTTITANIWMYLNNYTSTFETYFSYNAEEAGPSKGFGLRRWGNDIFECWGGTSRKLYKNGTLILSGSSVLASGYNTTGSWEMITLVASGISTWQGHNRLTLGTRSDALNTATNYKVGSFNIYNRELSASEIDNLYDAGVPTYLPSSSIVNQGLTVYYDFSNPNCYAGSGTTIYDLSGYNNNGTLTNGTSFDTTNGGALVFDGVDDYVQFTSTYAGTICFWGIMDANIPNLGALVGVTDTGDGALRPENLSFRGLDAPRQWNGGDNNDFQFGYPAQFMINGTSSLSTNGSGVFDIPNGRTLTQNFYVGAIGGRNVSTLSHTFMGRVYKGKMFKVMIYNRQLTNAELQQNFNAFKSQYGF
jgi:hypothetical protein